MFWLFPFFSSFTFLFSSPPSYSSLFFNFDKKIPPRGGVARIYIPADILWPLYDTFGHYIRDWSLAYSFIYVLIHIYTHLRDDKNPRLKYCTVEGCKWFTEFSSNSTSRKFWGAKLLNRWSLHLSNILSVLAFLYELDDQAYNIELRV